MVQKESCINIFTPTISMEVPINSLLAKNPQKKNQTTTTCWEFQNRHTFEIKLSNFTLTYKTL